MGRATSALVGRQRRMSRVDFDVGRHEPRLVSPMGNRNRRTRHGTDPGAAIRALRLEQLFREELNSILDGELGDARFDGVRVTLVELARDGSRARIWYAMKPTD